MRSVEFIDRHYLSLAQQISKLSYAIRRKVGCVIVKDRQIISDGYNGTPTGFSNVCEYTVDECNSFDNFLERFGNIIDNDDNEINYLTSLVALEKDPLVTKPEVLHAEANAITKLAKSTQSSVGATLYVTDEPCFECSKLIIQSGIVRVVYMVEYRKHDGIELLKKAGIEVVRYDEKEI